MDHADQHGGLDQAPFESAKTARYLLPGTPKRNIAGLESKAAQLVLVKIMGNFKRGNER